ncbi:hypothetical protein [Chromohalobacter israelensis]|uniref:hypothetical protein n=1 Tax=Chromohalobacter israelensis TaxID=141390 RepID=UPI0011D1CE4F|nr:hypothetical protein [Chromohalobacter salexigens]
MTDTSPFYRDDISIETDSRLRRVGNSTQAQTGVGTKGVEQEKGMKNGDLKEAGWKTETGDGVGTRNDAG